MRHPSPGVLRREPVPLRTLGLVASGAALGSVARHAATLAWPDHATAAVNITGALLLGVLWGCLSTAPPTPPRPPSEAAPPTPPRPPSEAAPPTPPRPPSEAAPRPRRGALLPFLGTGFCGGFTTFSTVMVSAHGTELAAGLAAMTAQLVGALLAAALGWWAASTARARSSR